MSMFAANKGGNRGTVKILAVRIDVSQMSFAGAKLVKRPPAAGETGRKPFVERERERKRLIDTKRANSTRRGYDGAWRALRTEFLAANPLCSEDGCRLPATDVDHIRAVRDRPDLRLIWSNLRSFCHVHHSRHTARTQGFARPGNEF
jgi:hypothetical protein